jgi:hypothetical protein
VPGSNSDSSRVTLNNSRMRGARLTMCSSHPGGYEVIFTGP